MEQGLAFQRYEVHAELERVRRTFAGHVAEMTPADLSRASNGTEWTNQELLLHMLFGYLVVRRLLPLVKGSDAFPQRPTTRSPRSSTRPAGRSTGSTTRAQWQVDALSAPNGWSAGWTR